MLDTVTVRPVLGLLLLLIFSSSPQAGFLERLFAPKAELWSHWAEHDETSKQTIEHKPWGDFLARYLVMDRGGNALLAYGRVSGPDRQALQAYIDSLSGLRISAYARGEQFAYWVNLYNALTVNTVLQHYPVDSIRDIDISPGFFSDGPWAKKQLEIEGQAVSLDDIEHRILRPIWQDPRVHYAVNCASLGCPNLHSQAFTAANTDRLLNVAARAFINHPKGVAIEQDRMTLSSIYVWFASDFETNGSLTDHLLRFAEPALAERLKAFDGITHDQYDWRLNDTRAKD